MTRDEQKTKAELLQELDALRRRVSKLKQVEEKLKHSEKQFKELSENTFVGVYRTTPDGRIKMANPALVRMLGYSSFEELSQRNLEKEEFAPQYPRSIFKDLIEKEGKVVGLESAWRKRDGTTLFITENAWIVRDESGKTLYYEGIAQDITERKRVEEALRESEEKYRSIFNTAASLIISIGTNGVIVGCNARIKDVLGYEREEVVGQSIAKIFHPDYMEKAKTCLNEVLTGGLARHKEYKMVRKDNKVIDVEINAAGIKNKQGKYVEGICNIEDITERKKAKEALRESEKMYREIVELAPDGIVTVDLKGIITSCNSALLQQSGYTKEDFVGKHISKVPTARLKDIPKYLKIFSSLLMGKAPKPFEFMWIHKDGSKYWGEASVSIMRRSGKITGFQTIKKDITERKKAEEALRKREELHELFFSQSLNGFFYMMFDEPIRWDDTVDKEKVLDYAFAHHRITKVNDAMLQQYGASREQFIGLTPNDLFAHDIAYGRNVWRDFLDAGRLHLETDERKRDGTPMWIDGDYICLYDSQGRITGHFGVQREITEEKRAREALRESEQKYRALVEQSLQGIIILQDFQIVFANPTAAKIAGLTVDEMLALSQEDIKAFIPIEERAAILQRYEERLADKPIENNYKLRLVRKNGDEFWLDVFVSKIEYLGKSAIQVAFIDITEHKRAEEAYRSLVDHSLQGLAILQNGRVVFTNQAMDDITGYTVEEMLTSPPEQVQAFVHPDDRELVWSQHRDRLNGEELPERYELRGIRKDGSICWLEIYASRIEFQGKPAIQVAYVDITERKKAEEALRDSESKYRTLVENLPQKIFLKDKNSVYVSCNDNFARDLKIRSEEITGKIDYDFFPKALANKYRADDKRIIEWGQTEAIEEKYIEDGKERIVHTVKTPVKDEQGNVTGVLGIFWDITELKQREEELNIYREKMTQAEQLASVGTLSATLAHELTQPLTVISLSIENSLTELEKTSCPDTVVEDLKEGLSEVSSMTTMVNRFRNFAKISIKRTVSKVDLKAVAERIANLLDESAWRAKVTLQVEGMDKLPHIYSCVRELEQLLFSLIENAIQAADGKKSRQVIISSVVKDEHIELQLSDNCGGIAPENLDRIFEPFFTTKPAGERTGLGLCIVERIVSQLGGKVRVESKLGKGSTFFVTLPIKGDDR